MSIANTLIRVGRRMLPLGRLEIVETDTATIQRLPCTTEMVDFAVTDEEQEVAVVTIPAKSVLESAFFIVSEIVDGTLDLGDDSDPDGIIDTNDIAKSVNATPNVILVGKYFAVETDVILTVGAGTTGAGRIGVKVTRYE